MPKNKLWIISELFYPDQTSTSYILSEIAKKMQKKYEVKVITGPKIYDKDKIISESNDSNLEKIEIFRVWIPRLNKNSTLQRFFRLLWISLGLFFKSILKIKSNDRVLLVTNPAPLIILMSWLKRLKKISTVLLVHDVFPENIIPANIISSPNSRIYKLLKIIFDKAYSSFDEFIVLGRDMKFKVEEKISNSKEKKISIVENWSDIKNISRKSRNESNLPLNKVILNYSGNIGRGQGLLELVEIISKVENKKIEFHIYGSGALENQIKEYIITHMLEERIKLFGPYAREDQNTVLNDCDLAVVSLNVGMYGLGIPSKTYNILAAGKPLLYLGDKNSEIDLLVRTEKIGFSFTQTQEQPLIDFLESLSPNKLNIFFSMGEKSRVLAETKYSKKEILKRFYEII